MKRILFWLTALLLSGWLSNVYATTRIGPGDIIRISVFGNPDLSLDTKVGDSGSISYPLIGEINVSGLSTTLAAQKIAESLESGGFLKKPQVNIVVTTIQSQQISVLGQVNRPGRYPIDGKLTLTAALAMAAGINADGGDVVTLIRESDGKPRRQQFDLASMMHAGDVSSDIDLVANDVLYVERAPRFYIYGEVQRPGYYRLERNMTVLHALSAGGGLTPRGTERGMRVKRRDATGRLETVKVQGDDLVQEGDIVYVQESLF